MINTPEVNFRYRGIRESSKLIGPLKGSLGDIHFLTDIVVTKNGYYESNIPTSFVVLDSTYQSVIQRARVIADFIRS